MSTITGWTICLNIVVLFIDTHNIYVYFLGNRWLLNTGVHYNGLDCMGSNIVVLFIDIYVYFHGNRWLLNTGAHYNGLDCMGSNMVAIHSCVFAFQLM